MRRFYLNRLKDISGVSGVGRVAEGVEFPNGMVALMFKSWYPCVNIYLNMVCVEQVHGHEGNTKVVWIDDNEPPIPEPT